MSSERFHSCDRLCHRLEFKRAFESRRSHSDDVLIVYACRNQLSYSRLGLTISRRYGSAIMRNAWKRRVREVFRRHRSDIPRGYDYVVLPKKGVVPNYHALARSLIRLLPRVAEKASREHLS